MTGTQIIQRLRDGRCVYGTHIASLMNPVAATMAAGMQLDFAFFCTEHMPIDRTEVSMLCQFYAAHGVSPIVRVPSPDATAISMALDGGAEGIVVPYLETEDEVRLAVGAVKYRPIKGTLLRDALSGRGELSGKTRQFLAEFNQGRYLIIGIESVAAMDNLERLLDAGAGEVDGVFLGPHDITTSMGIPTEYDNPAFIDRVEDVVRRCRARGVGVGLHTLLLSLGEPTLVRLLDAGLNWLLNGADISVMCQAMNGQLARLRALAGDGPDAATAEESGHRETHAAEPAAASATPTRGVNGRPAVQSCIT